MTETTTTEPQTPDGNAPALPSNALDTGLFRIATILWVIWGLVHVLAGVMTISKPASGAVAGIADAVDPADLELAYHPAVGAVLNQHGFNLLWAGLVTTIAAVFVWRRSKLAVVSAAVVSGSFDLGYFLFMDLGGHVKFVPGTLMTLICATAIILAFAATYRSRMSESA
ncbi:MAG: hypothetical protein AAF085_04270 [Planctomycetota bacterium]